MSNGSVDATVSIGKSATTIHGIVLILAAIMPTMAIITLVPVLPLLEEEFSYVEGYKFLVPIAMTIPALCVALFSPLAGWISDRVGRKNPLIIGLLVYAGIGIVPYFLSDLTHIIYARIVLGLAEAAIMTIATAMIGDYYKGKDRERWVAVQVAAVSLSAILLIAIGGILGEIFGSRGPFLLYVIAVPLAVLVGVVLFEPERRAPTESDAKVKLPLLRILPLLTTTLFVGVIFYIIIVKLGAILGLTAELTPGQIGGIGAAANIGVAVGSVLFGRFKGSSGQVLVLTGLALSALGYLGTGMSVNLIITSISVIVACLGFGILLPTLVTWVLKLLPDPVRGRGTGLWTGIFFLGQFVAPILAAALQTQLGGLSTVLLLFSGLCALGVLVAALTLRGATSLLTTD